VPKPDIKISDFSKHLFWDVDKSQLSIDDSKWYIIKRTLNFGLMNDWKLIYNYYGINEIAKHAVTYKDLNIRSASYISVLSEIPIEKFRCYTIKLSNPKHWSF
jgi:hypothetical protein